MSKEIMAFPTPPNAFVGMTLRDYFAAQALTALLHPDHVSSHQQLAHETRDKNLMMELPAHTAYRYADAMLAERAIEK